MTESDAELLDWYAAFDPRLRPGFLVVDQHGRERIVGNVEMMDYCRAAELLRRLERQVGRIDRFLSGVDYGQS